MSDTTGPAPALIRRAIADPGAVTPRQQIAPDAMETVAGWSTRAVIEVLREWLAGRTVVETPARCLPFDARERVERVLRNSFPLEPSPRVLAVAHRIMQALLASESSGDGVVAISRDDLQRAVWSGQMTQQQADDLLAESGQDGEPDA